MITNINQSFQIQQQYISPLPYQIHGNHMITAKSKRKDSLNLRVVKATDNEMTEHEQWLDFLDEKSPNGSLGQIQRLDVGASLPRFTVNVEHPPNIMVVSRGAKIALGVVSVLVGSVALLMVAFMVRHRKHAVVRLAQGSFSNPQKDIAAHLHVWDCLYHLGYHGRRP